MDKKTSDDILTFSSFLRKWSSQYSDVKNILSYLISYPTVLSKIELSAIVDPKVVDNEIKDWIWLCSKFTHPLEKEFFKPYWIPIVKDSLDYFIDISDESYPIFETKYFFLEPYRWYKKFLVKDIRELLLAHDERLNFTEFEKRNENQHLEAIHELFDKRREFGFDGILHVKKVTYDEVPAEEGSGISYKLNPDNTLLTISGVSSLAVGLLPHEEQIELKSLGVKYGAEYNELEKVKNIRDMVFLLRELGYSRIGSFSIELSRNGACIEFKEDQVLIKHSDVKLLDRIIDDLRKIQS